MSDDLGLLLVVVAMWFLLICSFISESLVLGNLSCIMLVSRDGCLTFGCIFFFVFGVGCWVLGGLRKLIYLLQRRRWSLDGDETRWLFRYQKGMSPRRCLLRP